MPKKPQDKEHVFVSKVKTPGWHRVADNLYIQVSKTGSKSWIFRYRINGKDQIMGLGSFDEVSLSKAREEASGLRALLVKGHDPLLLRKTEKNQKALEAARSISFEDCAKAYIDAHRDEWSNKKHITQWENTLKTFVHPIIGHFPVSAIDDALIIKIFEQKRKEFKGKTLWAARTETATRLRGRIEKILDYAKTKKYRTGDNPAQWRGHLEHSLPNPEKIRSRKHQPALPYESIGHFVEALRSLGLDAGLALEFLILTACRTNEVLKAKWEEINFDKAVWTVPAERTKRNREHRVPLTRETLAILKAVKAYRNDTWVFPGRSGKTHLSDTSLLMLIRRMNEGENKPTWTDPRQGNLEIVPHGFRSSFRDWCAERTSFTRDVAEEALSHAMKDKTESAYKRTDLFEKRRLLMERWATYCDRPEVKGGDNVKRIRN